MEDSDAREAGFINADMRGVDLYLATVSDANLSSADLIGTGLHSVGFEDSVRSIRDRNTSCNPPRYPA